ncbi:MAG: UTP--glucose-1-phosphate uridylyltransferase [Firmicutes bacterium]|nr:UTP--glucose-1-phosphate uridylyltransferase [Dethiobacter sp.]MBS3888375.1 UTP--glucose-1-phosphate uridylyltransferase [Bacillota bacterium]MBS4053189.1 UTP--glucose-1-phosphate uridylyltransferase [Thermaerobacter sp.]
MTIYRAVIPAAGFGTRMLPAAKAIPKEMVPVVDKPAIQYVVEEAVQSGVTDVLIVTGRGKVAIEDHFDRLPELEACLEARGKTEQLAKVLAPAALARISFVRQQQALGLGHAVGCAKGFTGSEPFFVLLPDDLVLSEVPVCRQLLAMMQSPSESVIAVQRIPLEDTEKYGVVSIDEATGLIKGIVEKPRPSEAPSNLAVVGRYLLQPEVFRHLEQLTPGAGGELQLTDALASMIKAGLPLRACEFVGQRFDTGNPLGLLEANIGMALSRPDMRDRVLEILATPSARDGA